MGVLVFLVLVGVDERAAHARVSCCVFGGGRGEREAGRGGGGGAASPPRPATLSFLSLSRARASSHLLAPGHALLVHGQRVGVLLGRGRRARAALLLREQRRRVHWDSRPFSSLSGSSSLPLLFLSAPALGACARAVLETPASSAASLFAPLAARARARSCERNDVGSRARRKREETRASRFSSRWVSVRSLALLGCLLRVLGGRSGGRARVLWLCVGFVLQNFTL